MLRGDPEPAKISTSYVERQNLTMRMGMRRFTRLNEQLLKEGREPGPCRRAPLHALQLCAGPPDDRNDPAVAAGVADHKWSLHEIAALLD